MTTDLAAPTRPGTPAPPTAPVLPGPPEPDPDLPGPITIGGIEYR